MYSLRIYDSGDIIELVRNKRMGIKFMIKISAKNDCEGCAFWKKNHTLLSCSLYVNEIRNIPSFTLLCNHLKHELRIGELYNIKFIKI
jgi:hypothetical protein